jgi:electron transfer flavoprotein alpha subunit
VVSTAAPLRIAVLVKQVPRFEDMELGPDGRLVRTGLELELNPYCRRAVSKGVELARESGGRCTVLTLGPPTAEDCLREAIGWGADEGVLVSDPAFAGSDTLATARALAAALRRCGSFDLVLCGKNSVDADTAQVPAQLAALLGLPLLTGVRVLEIVEGGVEARCERDDGWQRAAVAFPAVLTCAERLTEPAKVDPEGRAAVDVSRISRLSARDLGDGPWGQAGSPTVVGRVERLAVDRLRRRLSGDVVAQVREAVALLEERGAFAALPPPDGRVPGPGGTSGPGGVPGPGGAPGLSAPPVGPVAVVLEPERRGIARELLGGAAGLAAQVGSRVVAIAVEALDACTAGGWGADEVLPVEGSDVAEDVSAALAEWVASASPWAVLLPSTMWGREVGGRLAALAACGLVGDAVDLDVERGRLVCWKPAFGGGLVAAVTCTTAAQAATVRPGVLPRLAPRDVAAVTLPALAVPWRSRVRLHDAERNDDIDVLAGAEVVLAVGTGVPPDDYPLLEPLRRALGAELAATRKVTDKGWLPRARQVGITGRSIAPRLYVAVGVAGKFNHVVGVRGAGVVLAVNRDPEAPIFDAVDVGIVGDWHDVVPLLVDALREAGLSRG